MNHLSLQDLADYLAGNRTATREGHLAHCEECREALVSLYVQSSDKSDIPDALIERTVGSIESTALRSRIISIRTILPYALAAGVALCLIGAGIVLKHSRSGPVEAVSLDRREEIDTAGKSTSRGEVKPHRPAQNSSPIQVAGGRKERVHRFSSKTGALVDRSVRFREKSAGDSVLVIQMSSGEAIFVVEKGRYHSFRIQTTTAAVIVTGTVFSVNAGDDYTLVNVLEGSVTIQNARSGSVQKLKRSMGSIATLDSLIPVTLQSMAGLESEYKRLLDSLMVTRIDTSESSAGIDTAGMGEALKASRMALLVRREDADRSVLEFVRRYPASASGPELLYQLGRMYEEVGYSDKALEIYGRVDSLSASFWATVYRIGVLKMDRMKAPREALAGLERYLVGQPGGVHSEDALYRLIQLYGAPGMEEKKLNAMRMYVDRFGWSSRAESVTFQCAEILRTRHGEYRKALEYYELFLEKYPKSSMREQATRWVGWCLVHQGATSTHSLSSDSGDKEMLDLRRNVSGR